MLQARLENEQFNSLPVLVATDRLHTGYISTDRPDSSHLVDLHVYIIPKTVWKDVQHLAQNEAMDDAISAGFVRVPPSMKIRDVREAIEQLCGGEEYFPRDFIFLRSVGRCLTRVKPKQENELRVKNYRPPLTIAPEIYLLEGRHEDYAHLPTTSPALSSSSYMLGNRNQTRPTHDDFDHSPTRVPQGYQLKPMRAGKPYPPGIHTNGSVSHLPSSGRQSWSKFTQLGSDPDDASPKDFSKLKEEQERLRRRQAELERMRRAAEEKKAQTDRDEEEQRRRRQQEREEEERRRRQQEKMQVERRRLAEEENAATTIQASYRGFKDRKAMQERKRSQSRLPRREEVQEKPEPIPVRLPSRRRQPSSRLPTPVKFIDPENRPKSNVRRSAKISEQDRILQEIRPMPSRSPSIESISTVDSDRPASSKPRSQSQPSRRPSSSSVRTVPEKALDSSFTAHADTHETIDTAPFDIHPPPVIERQKSSAVTSRRGRSASAHQPRRTSSVTSARKAPSEVDETEAKTIADEIEFERREEEARRRRQIDDEEKRRAKELEEQRRKEAAKRQQHEDPETLRVRLHELRIRRADLERIREEIIRHLKNIHNRITLRRKEARDMWKKKYFMEKKKTPPLDERVNQLKADLEQIHRKTEQTIDAESKHAFQMGYAKESDVGHFLGQVTRNHHDIQEIRHHVEQVKLRLTTDIKLRNQAETECRTLRHELNQAKMNLTHIKTREQI